MPLLRSLLDSFPQGNKIADALKPYGFSYRLTKSKSFNICDFYLKGYMLIAEEKSIHFVWKHSADANSTKSCEEGKRFGNVKHRMGLTETNYSRSFQVLLIISILEATGLSLRSRKTKLEKNWGVRETKFDIWLTASARLSLHSSFPTLFHRLIWLSIISSVMRLSVLHKSSCEVATFHNMKDFVFVLR